MSNVREWFDEFVKRVNGGGMDAREAVAELAQHVALCFEAAGVGADTDPEAYHAARRVLEDAERPKNEKTDLAFVKRHALRYQEDEEYRKRVDAARPTVLKDRDKRRAREEALAIDVPDLDVDNVSGRRRPATDPATDTLLDPATGLPYPTDPATGLPIRPATDTRRTRPDPVPR